MAEAAPSPVPASTRSGNSPISPSLPKSQETPAKSVKQLRPDAPDFTPSPRPQPPRPSPSPHGAGRGQSPRGRGSFRPPRGHPSQRAGSLPSPRTPSATSVSSTPSTPKEHVPRGYIPPTIQTPRASAADIEAKMAAMRIKSEEATRRFQQEERDRQEYEDRAARAEAAERARSEREEKNRAELVQAREDARQRKLKQADNLDLGKDYQPSYRSPAPARRTANSDDHTASSSYDDEEDGGDDLDLQAEIGIQEAKLRLLELKRARIKKASGARMTTGSDGTMSIADASPRHAAASLVMSPKFGRSDHKSEYSPGFGLRPAVLHDAPLPPAEDLITPDGVVHRQYPAPSPVSPAVNLNEGWGDADPIGDTSVDQTHPSDKTFGSSADDANESSFSDLADTSIEANTGFIASEPPKYRHPGARASAPPQVPKPLTPPQSDNESEDQDTFQVIIKDNASETTATDTKAPANGSYIPWEPIVYSDPKLNEAEEITREDLLSCLQGMKRDREKRDDFGGPGGGDRGGRFGFQQSQGPDNGWPRRAPGGEDAGFGPPDASGGGGGGGWGPPGGDRGESRWDADGDNGRAGGGGGDGCRICHASDHWSRECPKKDLCRKCGKDGHYAADCTEPLDPNRPFGGECHNCGERGHRSSECSAPLGNRFFGNCNVCGEKGHRGNACPNPDGGGGDGWNNGSGDGFGAPRGWGPGGSGGQDHGAPSAATDDGDGDEGGWGAPAPSSRRRDDRSHDFDSAAAPPPPPPPPSAVRGPPVNPQRAAMMGLSDAQLSRAGSGPVSSDYHAAEEDDDRRGRDRAPVRPRAQTPVPAAQEDAGEFGGW